MIPAIPNAPQVLLFGFWPEERTMRIIRYLTTQGVRVRTVPSEEYHESLGYLFGLPDYEHRPAPTLPVTLAEEMLVMQGFGQQMLDDFLRFFKREQLRRVELKAVLTPTNAAWSAAELCRHMTLERDAMQKRVKNT